MVIFVAALLLRLSGRDIAVAPALLFSVSPSRRIFSGKRIMMPVIVAFVFMLMTPVFALALMLVTLGATMVIPVLLVIASHRRHGQTQTQQGY